MRRCLLLMGVLVLAPPLLAQDKPAKPATAAERYKSLEAEFAKAEQAFEKAMQSAKSADERRKAFELFPKPETFASKFLKLAEDHPKDPAAVDALVWVASNAPDSAAFEKAVGILAKDHLESPKLADVCDALADLGDLRAEKFLRGVLDKNPSRQVKAHACFGLARLLRHNAEGDKDDKAKSEKLSKEAEDLFERTIKEFGVFKYDDGSFADAAKIELFSLRNLGIGKTAPDIDGIDADGKKFKLSDYKGKVVLLDFWASW